MNKQEQQVRNDICKWLEVYIDYKDKLFESFYNGKSKEEAIIEFRTIAYHLIAFGYLWGKFVRGLCFIETFEGNYEIFKEREFLRRWANQYEINAREIAGYFD